MLLGIIENGIKILLNGICIADFSVGKGHALADVEGVFLTILGNVPALGQSRHGALRTVIDQSLKNHTLCYHGSGIQVHIDVLDVGGNGHGNGTVGGLFGIGSLCRGSDSKHHGRRKQNTGRFFHGFPHPFSSLTVNT